MITPVRVAYPSILLAGVNYFGQLAPYFLTLSYTDNADGQRADDLQLQLADRDRRFISDWMPDKGTSLEVEIICERWFAPNAAALRLDCGEFWIDTIDFELPQHTVSVKCSSIPSDAHIKPVDETRGWEDSTLKDIAEQIAGENGMSVDYQATFNPQYKRIEQMEESGLQFLKKRADDVGLSIKLVRKKIIFFDEQEWEQRAPSFTLVYGNGLAVGSAVYRMSGGHFSNKNTDTKKSATVAHVNPETGRLVKEKYEASDDDLESEWNDNLNADPDYQSDEDEGGDGEQLRRKVLAKADEGLVADWNANDPSDNAGKGAGGKAAAQRKARAVVRDANKEKETASVDLSIGNPLIAAGQTFMLVGVGQFDGKWFIESATHHVGPKYTTSLNIRRCLEGY